MKPQNRTQAPARFRLPSSPLMVSSRPRHHRRSNLERSPDIRIASRRRGAPRISTKTRPISRAHLIRHGLGGYKLNASRKVLRRHTNSATAITERQTKGALTTKTTRLERHTHLPPRTSPEHCAGAGKD